MCVICAPRLYPVVSYRRTKQPQPMVSSDYARTCHHTQTQLCKGLVAQDTGYLYLKRLIPRPDVPNPSSV
jgi:hypothetical protein